MKKKHSSLQRRLAGLSRKNKRIILLTACLLAVLVSSVTYVFASASKGNSDLVSTSDSVPGEIVEEVQNKPDSTPTASAPSSSKPKATTSPKPQEPSCLTKSQDNSYHSCVLSLNANSTTVIQITLNSHPPEAGYSEFVDWLKSDQIDCVPASCTLETNVVNGGKLTAQATLTTTTTSKATIKARNYLNAMSCGIACRNPVFSHQYRFSGFTVAADKITLNYSYQCTSQPTGCVTT